MLVIACSCGQIYTVLHGPVVCPRCGCDAPALELDEAEEEPD